MQLAHYLRYRRGVREICAVQNKSVQRQKRKKAGISFLRHLGNLNVIKFLYSVS